MRSWLDPANAAEFEAMGSRARRLGRPDAVYKIVADLAQLAEAPDERFGPAAAAKAARAGRAAAKGACCSGSGGGAAAASGQVPATAL